MSRPKSRPAVAAAKGLKIGPGWEEGIDVGPLFEKRSLENTTGFIVGRASEEAAKQHLLLRADARQARERGEK